ncbi:FG-GAP-like repeat-containing protein [Haloferula rosea]|uniref:FG-GAP repeat protein n=1 Tax=Haloferula rosea TaxID=490093 RepID=A0A934R880_9BACT|nr:FG-GAP-like repeat-containing protein [Haloferula rosea]MBK1825758.1 FG-GAP repeat protein [Haloferula rosea]
MKPPYHPNWRSTRQAFGLIAGSPCLIALHAAELDFTLAAANDNFALGSAFAAVGDWNDDGTDDFAVSDPQLTADGFFSSGAAYIISGADGQILDEFGGEASQSQFFGASLASLDADGDGITDLAVGAPYGQFYSGSVWIYSGADGSLILQVTGSGFSQFGSALAPAGDQDGDGIDDLFVGAPGQGRVEVISGATGFQLWSVSSTEPTASFGVAIAPLGDIDGDSKPDLAVGAPGSRPDGAPVGQVALFGSSDQTRIANLSGNSLNNGLGATLAAVDDSNNDGLPDLMVGSSSGGTCFVVSGTDLSIVHDLSIPNHPFAQPIVVGGGIDDDGDGFTDWLIGSPGFKVGPAGFFGGFRMISGEDGSLLLDVQSDSPFTYLGKSLSILPGLGFVVGEPRLADTQTGGYGSAQFWKVDLVVDSDGDGVPDSEDANPNSNTTPTIELFGSDTGVENRLDENGITLTDRFDSLPTPEELGNQGRFVTRFVDLIKDLEGADLISAAEARAIRKAGIKALARGSKK